MRHHFYILFFLTIFFSSCKQSKGTINALNSEGNYISISLKKLIDDSNSFKNKPIEVEGFFNFKMEESSISITENSNYNEKVWVEFNFLKELKNQKGEYFFKDNNLIKYNNKKVKVKGVYNTKYNGHMAWYKGSINVKEFIYNDEKYLIDSLSYGNNY